MIVCVLLVLSLSVMIGRLLVRSIILMFLFVFVLKWIWCNICSCIVVVVLMILVSLGLVGGNVIIGLNFVVGWLICV